MAHNEILKYGMDRDNEKYDDIVQAYIIYYHKRATRCKWEYYVMNTIKLVGIALIPVLQAIGILDQYAWTVTGLSAIVLFVESFMEMTRFREKWLMYRNTCNQLLSIQRQNAMHTYKEEDEKYEARLQYVQAVEELVGDEAKQWYAVNKKEERKNK